MPDSARMPDRSVFQDWSANAGNPKGKLVMLAFRVAHLLRFGPRWLFPLTAFYGICYRILVEWVLGVELPWKTKVGPGLRLEHGQALVVNDGTIIGVGCTLRNGVTIGIKQTGPGRYSSAPVLGDGVDIGANASIIGPVRIGDGAVIGAGAVVVKDVPADAVVGGNPAKILRSRRENGSPASGGGNPSCEPVPRA